MINAVLIDDERPSLKGLEIFLREYPEVRVAGMFTNPLKALDQMEELKPQVVFLDINMPQLRGMDAASKILDLSPDTDIVFVTAYDHYAIEAFELHALDYLLKPLRQERLAVTVSRLLSKKQIESRQADKSLEIRCLGDLQVGWRGEAPVKWRSEKTRELFAFLLLHKEQTISKEELLDTLWPEDDPERAVRQLYNGIYYIRKALGAYGIDSKLISIDSKYHMHLMGIKPDVECFYELEKGGYPESIAGLEALAVLYTGDYLETDYYDWANLERERLLRIYLKCLLKLSRLLMAQKSWEQAEKYLLSAYRKNPYEEDITECLLQLYATTQNSSKAIRHFNSYTELLRQELGIRPSEKLQNLRRIIS